MASFTPIIIGTLSIVIVTAWFFASLRRLTQRSRMLPSSTLGPCGGLLRYLTIVPKNLSAQPTPIGVYGPHHQPNFGHERIRACPFFEQCSRNRFVSICQRGTKGDPFLSQSL